MDDRISRPDRGWEFFSSPPRPDRLRCQPSLISNGYSRYFLQWEKWTGREDDDVLPYSAEVRNPWSNTSIHPYVFMVWCLVKPKDI